MKKSLLFFAFLFLLPCLGWCRFSQFVRVTPKVNSDHLLKVKVEEQGDNYLVSLSEIKKADGWQIELEQPAEAEEQSFRDFIWHKRYPQGKVLKITKIHSNKSGKPVVVKRKIPKTKAERIYFYFDNPREVADGGYYFTVDLATYIKSVNK
jgi:hypothetical protein